HRSTQNRLLRAWHQLAVAKEMYEVDRQRAEELLEQVRHDIDHVRAVDIRQVSHELHPSIVRAGLLPAVESVVARYEDVVSIQVEIDDAVRARDGAGRGPARAVEAGDARRVRGEAAGGIPERSEERRVGKEGRAGGWSRREKPLRRPSEIPQ